MWETYKFVEYIAWNNFFIKYINDLRIKKRFYGFNKIEW